MLIPGSRFTSEITDTTVLGTGYVSVDSLAVFVRGAVAGDVCTFEICEVKRNYAVAECRELITPSVHRCAVDCPVFPECGGCVHRGITPEYESNIKFSAVSEAFRRASLADVPISKMMTVGSAIGRYRNKAVYHFNEERDCGFYSSRTRRVIPGSAEHCRCVPEIFSDIVLESAQYMKVYREIEPEELMLRISTSGEISAALTVRYGCCDGYAEHIRSRFPSIIGVSVRVSGRNYDTVSGKEYITSELLGLNFRISPEAFFQVNYEGAELLLKTIISASDKFGVKRGVDLYCGTGVIGIALAAAMPQAEFIGVEQNSSAVSDAVCNAELCGVGNIGFLCGDAAKLIPQGDCDLAVVDPPRRGLSPKALNELSALSPENLIYVSCNPQTLARDLARLTEAGYCIGGTQPINMFPRTEHVETIVLLQNRNM